MQLTLFKCIWRSFFWKKKRKKSDAWFFQPSDIGIFCRMSLLSCCCVTNSIICVLQEEILSWDVHMNFWGSLLFVCLFLHNCDPFIALITASHWVWLSQDRSRNVCHPCHVMSLWGVSSVHLRVLPPTHGLPLTPRTEGCSDCPTSRVWEEKRSEERRGGESREKEKREEKRRREDSCVSCDDRHDVADGNAGQYTRKNTNRP